MIKINDKCYLNRICMQKCEVLHAKSDDLEYNYVSLSMQ